MSVHLNSKIYEWTIDQSCNMDTVTQGKKKNPKRIITPLHSSFQF